VSVAGLVCLKAEARGRFFYRVRVHRGRKGERRSMSEADYAGLITAAHQQLHAPVILIWDNLNTHISAVMRTFTGAHSDWLTVIQLPSYAPDLNPAEGVWANMKNGLGNLAAPTVSDLAAIVKNRLKRIQYRPELITDSSPRPDSPSNPNRRSLRPWSFSLCSCTSRAWPACGRCLAVCATIGGRRSPEEALRLP
jgi:transposase